MEKLTTPVINMYSKKNCCSPPLVSDSPAVEKGLRISISNKSGESLMLLVWGPLFENHFTGVTCPNLLSQQMAESGGICLQGHVHSNPAFLISTLVLICFFPVGLLVNTKYLALSALHAVYYFISHPSNQSTL